MKIAEIDIIVKILGFLGSIGVILFGIIQYKKGQRWQKANILLTLIDHFENDKNIRVAREMLDWDKRSIIFDDTRKMIFDNSILIRALAVVEMDDDTFTEEESFIRDAFDSFFDFFHKLYSFQKSELLKFEDFAYFFYYFELIRDIEHYKKGNEGLKVIVSKYIDKYHFIGIKHLLKQYERHPEPLDIMTEGSNKRARQSRNKK
ncbi:MAG: hypothetical protein LBE36_12560 [Flavobacteriaceae bacterium]|jgi:hypothetical protein|nr:hypothetical protein [Flavobacteriaceae bacterium]